MTAAFAGAPGSVVRAAWLRYRSAEMTLLALPFAAAVLIPIGASWWGGLTALFAIPLALAGLATACEIFTSTRGAIAGQLGPRLLRPSERLLRAQALQSCPTPLLLHSWHDGELGCAVIADEALFLADRESDFEFARIGCESIIGLQYLRGATRNLIVLEFFDHDRQRARRHLPFVDANSANGWNQSLRHLLQTADATSRRQA